MKLDYAFKDSIYVSSEKWGKYLDARFIDKNNTIRPLQVHFELLPRGFTNKVCITFNLYCYKRIHTNYIIFI